MKPTSLLILMALIWVITNFWLLPLVSQRWQAAAVREKVARAGILAVLEKLRDLALIACIVLLLIVAQVAIANRLGMSTIATPAILAAAESVYVLAKSWNEKYALALTWIALVGVTICLYMSARTAKRRVTVVWAAKAAEVFEGFASGADIDQAREDERLRPIVEALDARIVDMEALREMAVSETRDAAIDRCRAQIGILLNTLAVEIAAEDLDVEAALRTRAPDEREQAPSRLAKLRKILISEQLAKDLGMLRKPMSYVLMGLVVVGLVGWTAEPMANSLQLAVNALRVNVFEETTSRELQAVSVRPPEDDREAQPEPDDSHDENELPDARTVARMLAHAATNDLLKSRLLRSPAVVEGGAMVEVANREAGVARADLVRAALIDAKPADVDGNDIAGKVKSEAAAELSQARAGTTSDATAAFRSKVEEQIVPSVEDLRKHHPGVFARLARTAAARYESPISPLDAQGKIVSEMLGRVFSEVDAAPTGEAGKQAQRLLKEFGEKSFNTWALAAAKRYVSDEIVHAARPKVLESMIASRREQALFEAPAWADKLAEQLQRADQSGRRWSNSDAIVREASMLVGIRDAANDILVDAVGKNQIEQSMFEIASTRLQSLQDYDALFPPDIGSMTEVVGGGGEAGGGSAGRPNGARKPAMNFHRARVSFAVRGVIIGRDLGGAGMAVDGLRWHIRKGKPPTTQVILDVRIDDKWRSLGAFDAAVVNQALRYAADRRVIATTIVQGDGMIIERMTNTHPALIDTPLGCRVIEVDRFVDTLSSTDQVPAALATLASDRQQMWRWLQRAKITQHVALAPVDDEAVCVSAVSKWTFQQPMVRFSPAVSSGLASFAQKLEGRDGGNARWLAAVDACTAHTGEMLAKCVCKAGMKAKIGSPYWYPEDHTSQVRERDANIDKDLAWLGRTIDRLGHFDFAVHTTFAMRSPEDAEPIDEALADAYDFPSGQMKALRTALGLWIPDYVSGKGNHRVPIARSYQDFMGPLEDFVTLQRLFRAGFSGRLGGEFPYARLLLLERETRAFVPVQRTVRWETGEAVPQELFMANLKKRNPEAEAAYREWAVERMSRERSRVPICDVVSK